MFELKKHVKERLIKRTEGIISLLLIVLLVPFYSVAAILEEVGRYQSALRGLDSAISSSEMSVLAQYDQFLMDRFALLAIDQNKNIEKAGYTGYAFVFSFKCADQGHGRIPIGRYRGIVPADQ